MDYNLNLLKKIPDKFGATIQDKIAFLNKLTEADEYFYVDDFDDDKSGLTLITSFAESGLFHIYTDKSKPYQHGYKFVPKLKP